MSMSHAALGMPRLDLVVLDCPDPRSLGRFYARVLGWEAESEEDGWVTLRGPGEGAGIAFQRVADHQPPTWPDGARPQQLHLDLSVHDIASAEPAVLAAGATVHEHQPSENGGFKVYLDPAGHPFCLCVDD